MHVLLKSGQFASREEAVEEMMDCRSMKEHWCRSTVMPEYGLSIVYVFSKPLLTAKLYFIPSSRLGEKGRTPLESSWNSIWLWF
ncbi:hypothetical protein F2Q70_00030238 [Brassica cretica]|uniref:Uncharacterized protein n=1 Tax=Brassica cretica TaxID=69181 RepID=A0A8S9FJM4_BRACR|nr:hypothetical protein F2Q70_00030238 [Brassica cretica]